MESGWHPPGPVAAAGAATLFVTAGETTPWGSGDDVGVAVVVTEGEALGAVDAARAFAARLPLLPPLT